MHILRDYLGDSYVISNYRNVDNKSYKTIHDILCREYGLFQLNKNDDSFSDYSYNKIQRFFWMLTI